MIIHVLTEELTVCQIPQISALNLESKPLFLSITEDELSVVAPTTAIPAETLQREDGWRGLKIDGVLDFSLVGILAKIATLLANNDISIFAISTYNTDYFLVKGDQLEKTLAVLRAADYKIER